MANSENQVNQTNVVSLDPALISAIVKEVRVAVHDETVRLTKDRNARRRRGVKKLLRNYRSLAGHRDNAVFSADDVDQGGGFTLADILESIQSGGEFEVVSIRKSAVRTRIIMDHVDVMLGVYKACCEQSSRDEDARRYRVIYDLYLADEAKTYALIANDEHVDKSTVYRDAEIAIEQFTVLLFGIDALENEI